MQARSNGFVPNTMLGLSYGEHFIIWGIRRIIRQRGPDALLLDECVSVFGEDGEAGLGILSVFLGLLGRSARRVFDIGSPDTLFTTRDEHCILVLLAAAQIASETDEAALLNAHLCWLSKPGSRPELAQVALALARLLNAHGHRLASILPKAPEWDDCAACSIRLIAAPVRVSQPPIGADRYHPGLVSPSC